MMRPVRDARILAALLPPGAPRDEANVARLLTPLEPADWSRLLLAAGEELLTPELAPALRAPALAACVPPEVIGHVEERRRLNAARNARIAEQATELLDGFASGGIRPLLMKGLRDLSQGDGGRPDRVVGDLDLLLPENRILEAIGVLQRLGYRWLEQDTGGSYAVAGLAREGEPAAIDLRRELLRESHLLPAAEVLRRAAPATAFGRPVLVAAPADELLHRAMHEMTHHFAYRDGRVSLRALADVVTCLPRLDGAEWDALRKRAAAARCLTPLAATLRLAGWTFGTEALPAEARRMAARPFARLAAGRVLSKALGLLPRPLDGAWSAGVRALAGFHHRGERDGPIATWRLRRVAAGVGRIARTRQMPQGE